MGPPEAFDEHVALMFDLMAAAFQADVTRVFTFMMMRDVTGRSFPHIGVSDPHHALSHEANGRSNDPTKPVKFAKVNTHFVSMFAKFVEKLRATPDGDGTLLDHSMVLFGSGMGNANDHTHHPLPTVVLGGGAGAMKARGSTRRIRAHRWPTCCWRWRRRPGRRSSRSAPATSRSTSEQEIDVRSGLLTIVFLLGIGPVASRAETLFDAVRAGDRQAVRALIAGKADVNATQVDGSTALHLAVDAGDEEMARLLLRAGARADHADALRRHAAGPGGPQRQRQPDRGAGEGGVGCQCGLA